METFRAQFSLIDSMRDGEPTSTQDATITDGKEVAPGMYPEDTCLSVVDMISPFLV